MRSDVPGEAGTGGTPPMKQLQGSSAGWAGASFASAVAILKKDWM